MYLISNKKLDCLKEKSGFYVNDFFGVDNSYRVSTYSDDSVEDCFYTDIKFETNRIVIELDEILFDSPFVYIGEDFFVISSDFNQLLELLNKEGIEISKDEQGCIERIFFGSGISNKTIFNEISRVTESTLLKNVVLKRREIKIYNTISPEEEANWLYNNINELFSFVDKDKSYSIGLSGGLDSRVGAYFAKKNNLNLSTYFVGKEKGKLGIDTFDSRISKKLARIIGIDSPTFIDPTALSWDEKINNDVEFSAENIANSHINCGYNFLEKNTVVINGAMGGELFGACLRGDEEELSIEELTERVLSFVNLMPKIKGERFKLVKYLVKLGFFKGLRYEDDFARKHVLTNDINNKINIFLRSWIKGNKEKGYTNIQVIQLFLYERLGRNHRRGYFFSLSGKYKVLPTYLRPSVFNRMMSWEGKYFSNKRVQFFLLKKMPELYPIKSQNVMDLTTGSNYKQMAYLVERVIRGGGMDYQYWVRSIDVPIDETYITIKNNELLHDLLIDSPTMKLTYIKLNKILSVFGR